ncbi:MAG: phosphatidate cytidylyltransferase [Clostridia bacterium]|nr:phosphatidate cytidylyltransferase [Clostridia bacterium]
MKRIATGAVGILVMIPICFFSHTVVWSLALTFFSVVAVHEMLSCIGAKGETPFAVPAYLFATMPLVAWLLTVRFPVTSSYKLMFIYLAVFLLWEMMAGVIGGNRYPTEKLYSLVALVAYVVVALTAICLIRFINDGASEGAYIYLLIFLGAWISDTFAYFTGRLLGKHKLCPAISPKKTVEGSVGGVVFNMLAFAGYALILRHFFDVNANVLFFAILGALFSAIGQFGDLFASCIKRHYGVKDYGKLFPGHGGVLDRFDSTLAIALVMLVVYSAFGAGFLIR